MTAATSLDRAEDLADRSLNLELFVCTEILRLNSLHYGYWDNPASVCPQQIDLADVRRAQARYTETLIDRIPDDVASVLDVGCGIGDVARALVARGLRVTAISPDRNHARYFNGHDDGLLRFHNLAFEEFHVAGERYDLILMSESQNYIDADAAFAQTRRYVRPGGYLLISGLFRRSATAEFAESYVEDAYVARAATYGLRVSECIDISTNVLPTLAYARLGYDRYLRATLQQLIRLLGKRSRRKLTILRWLFARELARLEQARRLYEERLDTRLFSQRMRYRRLLFVEESGRWEGTLPPGNRDTGADPPVTMPALPRQ